MTNGFIDDVPVRQVREWERGFHEFMANEFPQVGENLRTGKALRRRSRPICKRGIEEYKKTVPAREAGRHHEGGSVDEQVILSEAMDRVAASS